MMQCAWQGIWKIIGVFFAKDTILIAQNIFFSRKFYLTILQETFFFIKEPRLTHLAPFGLLLLKQLLKRDSCLA
jgi:hypothetical protein